MSARSAVHPRRARPPLQRTARILLRRPRRIAQAVAALIGVLLAARAGALGPALILAGAGAGGSWLYLIWWPRQVAGLTAPRSPLVGRRLAVRIRGHLLDPVSAGIVPARTILGRRRGRFVQARHRIGTLVVGPPQVGKTTGVIIPNVMAWLGSVVVTSTKRDVLDACAAVRAHRGTAWCFDPLSVIGPPPAGVRPLLWSPLAGCSEWDVAARRAGALAVNAGRGSEDAHHWRDRGTQLLAALMQAAALGGSPMSTLCEWVHSGISAAAETILERQQARQAQSRLSGVIHNTAPRERTSIWSVVAGILRPFDDSRVLAGADAAASSEFDPAAFLDGANTVFVVAPSDGAVSLAPLVVGLVEEVRLAGLRVSDDIGRVPIPLLLALDEVANICPLPALPAIVSEGGGRNMVLLLAFQDLTQAADRWGEPFARGLLTYCGAKLVLPGVSDPETLRAFETLCGTRKIRKVTRTHQRQKRGGDWEITRSRQWGHQHELFRPAASIRQLRRGTALAVVEHRRPLVVGLPHRPRPWPLGPRDVFDRWAGAALAADPGTAEAAPIEAAPTDAAPPEQAPALGLDLWRNLLDEPPEGPIADMPPGA